MHESDQDASPIKNWKQLVVIVALAFVVPITIIVILSQYVTSAPTGAEENDEAVLRRIKPVGDVQLALPSGPKGQLSGEQVYDQVCKTCHEGGLAGAPKVGDNAAWARVIAQGLAPTVDHAIKGIRAMPPKGGNPDFEDIEVERAVIYMANRSGGSWKEPPGRGNGRRRGAGPARRSSTSSAPNATPPASTAHRRSATARRGRPAWPRASTR